MHDSERQVTLSTNIKTKGGSSYPYAFLGSYQIFLRAPYSLVYLPMWPFVLQLNSKLESF